MPCLQKISLNHCHSPVAARAPHIFQLLEDSAGSNTMAALFFFSFFLKEKKDLTVQACGVVLFSRLINFKAEENLFSQKLGEDRAVYGISLCIICHKRCGKMSSFPSFVCLRRKL